MKKDITDIQFKAVCWAIGILIVGIGWLFTCYAGLSARVQAISDYQSDINSRLTKIETDLSWIRSYMEKKDSSFTDINNNISKN
jgi:hypothetical protein